MNKPIIIDGVDVSECHHFDKDNNQRKVFDCYEIEGFPNFCKGDNCYYKQLQRLKAENEELKEKVNSYNCSLNCYKYRKSDKYKQAFEEIRDCINVLSTVDNDFKGSMVEWKIYKILNEVLKDE